jgi:hypothetical protein
VFKPKGEVREGEGVLFRKDRFRLVKTHDISLTAEFKSNPVFERVWNNISKNEEFATMVGGRNTILQVKTYFN